MLKHAMMVLGLLVCAGGFSLGCAGTGSTTTSGSTSSAVQHRTSTTASGTASTGTGTGTGGSGGTAGTATGGTTGAATCTPKCKAPAPVCSPSGSCVECLSSTDCAGTPATPLCETDTSNNEYGNCHQCLTSADCSSVGANSVCDPVDLTCSTSDCRLGGDAGCDPASAIPSCDPGSGACVQCVDDSSCSFGSPVCVQNQCTNCSQENPCASDGGSPYCNLEGACVVCMTNADCKDGGVCNYPNPGTCQ